MGLPLNPDRLTGLPGGSFTDVSRETLAKGGGGFDLGDYRGYHTQTNQ